MHRTCSRHRGKALLTIVAASAANIFLASTGAIAADLPRRSTAPAPVPVAAPPIFTWTGFYLGANAGWGGRRQTVGFTVVPGASNPNIARPAVSGGIIGLQGGYNWQYGSLVLGLETDFQITGMRQSFGPVGLAGGGIASGSQSLPWYGTLRPRIGYAIGRTLLFATGGLAYGHVRNRLASTDGAGNTFTMPAGKTRFGWTLGGGIEHAFTSNWSAKLEYGYVALGHGTRSAAVFNAGVPTGATASARNRNSFHTLRAGVNYRF